MSPYKDAEAGKDAAKERKRRQRMGPVTPVGVESDVTPDSTGGEGVTPEGNVTPVGVESDVTPAVMSRPDVTPLRSGYTMPTRVAAGTWRQGTCVECGKPVQKGDNCCHSCFFGKAGG